MFIISILSALFPPPHTTESWAPLDVVMVSVSDWRTDPSEGADSACQQVQCREARRMGLRIDDTTGYTFDVPHFPYAIDNLILVFPEEEFSVAGDVADGTLKNLHAAQPGEPALLDVSFSQMDGKPGMFLNIKNNSDYVIKYSAYMVLPEKDGAFYTSSCPLRPNGFSVFEHWPHPIIQLVLTDFEVYLADSAQAADLSCE